MSRPGLGSASSRRVAKLIALSPLPLFFLPLNFACTAPPSIYFILLHLDIIHQMYPVFWTHRGPNIPVRRGRWFFDERRPCPEEMSDELEEGYMKIKPWVVSIRRRRHSLKPSS